MTKAPLLSAAATKKLDAAMKLLQEVIQEANPHMAATTAEEKRKRLADLFATREKITAQVAKTSNAADAKAHRLGAAAAKKAKGAPRKRKKV